MYIPRSHFLRWGWVFLERTQFLSWIQFTTHFIDFFVVKTKHSVGSSGNVILTRQTCGQRSSRAAKSNRRALENNFPERICYMFFIPEWMRSRSVPFLGTCEKRYAAQCQMPIFCTGETCFFSEVVGFIYYIDSYIQTYFECKQYTIRTHFTSLNQAISNLALSPWIVRLFMASCPQKQK